MKIDEILLARRILCSYLGNEDDSIAIGGYPALVVQGILKEERATKDIDIVKFTDNIMALPNIAIGLDVAHGNELSIIRRDFKDKIQDLIAINIGEVMSVYSGRQKQKKKNKVADVIDQYLELMNLGVNRSFTIKLTKADVIIPGSTLKYDLGSTTYVNITSPYGYEVYPPHGSPITDLNKPAKMVNISMLSSMLSRYAPLDKDIQIAKSTDNLEVLLQILKVFTAREASFDQILKREILDVEAGEKMRIEHNSAVHNLSVVKSLYDSLKDSKSKLVSDFYQSLCPMNALNLSGLFINNKLDELNIDVFAMGYDKRDHYSVLVNGARFVHYYLILKAKYEYCKNRMTDLESFEKHINDLIKSYDAKKIHGINSPKDIDWLLANRAKE